MGRPRLKIQKKEEKKVELSQGRVSIQKENTVLDFKIDDVITADPEPLIHFFAEGLLANFLGETR